MTKSFKIARKPGQPAQDADGKPQATRPAPPAASKSARPKRANGAQPAAAAPLGSGPTTRKTIEVPEDYFYMVKMQALQRHMKEKDLWAEILREYFKNKADV